MNRGNSLIAGVVLIGILGTLSIALQATMPTTQKADSFAVQQRHVAATAATKTPELPKMGCFEDFEYAAITGKDGQIKTGCKQRSNTCSAVFAPQGINSKDAYVKADALPTCISAVEESGKTNKGKQSCQVLGADKCDLTHCFADPANPGQLKGCVKVKNGTFKSGDGFAPAANQAFGLKQLVDTAAGQGQEAKDAQGIVDQLKTDSSMKGPLDSAFKEQVAEQQQKVQSAEYNLANGGNTEEEAKAARSKLEEEQKKLKEMEAMQKRLATAQTGEVGTCPSGNTCTKGAQTPNGGGGDRNGDGNGNGSGARSPSTGFGNPLGNQQQAQKAAQQNAQQNAQAYQQQCQARYYCANNTLYWGSPNSVTQNQYNPGSDYYGTYSPYTTQCQSQMVQQCPQGCAPGGTQCAGSGTAPVSDLFCGDRTSYDTGEQVPLKYSCTNAVSSTGNGFSTNGLLVGIASTTVQRPPAGADMVSYGLTCTGSTGQTSSDRCDVKINLTSMVIVSNPKQVLSGASTTIGWVTKGMKECVIWTPDAEEGSILEDFNDDNAGNTSVAGVAVTPGLTEDTEFVLGCITKNGQERTSSLIVKIRD